MSTLAVNEDKELVRNQLHGMGIATIFVSPEAQKALKAGYVKGYRACLEDNLPNKQLSDGEIAQTAAGRF